VSRIHDDLLAKGLLTQDQHNLLEDVASCRKVSVFHDLRALLYIGVLLFTSGIGILIYKNIGDIGHIVAIAVLMLMTAACFYYVFQKGPGYRHEEVKGPTPYFEYVVLLGSLLLISVQGYLQFQYDLFADSLGFSTGLTALIFFYVAYRFDHLGVLSLGITALASFFSITISPKKWSSGDFFEGAHVYMTAVGFAIVLAGAAVLLDRRNIKSHFTFTYINFALLIFFTGAVSGLFVEENWLYLAFVYGGVVFAYISARRRKSFLFLLYAFLAAYVGTTYWLSETLLRYASELWFYYSILSCGGFVYFIVKYRNYFSRNA